MIRALTLAFALFAACCTEPRRPEPSPTDAGPSPVVPPDSGFIEPFDVPGGYASPSCAAACANLLAHACPEATSRPGEDSCYVVCKRAESTGGRIDFKPSCIAAAHGVDAIRACNTYRCSSAP